MMPRSDSLNRTAANPLHSTAALFQGVEKPWEFPSIPLRDPAPGEILVKVLACTICGSDLHTICGRRHAHPPAVLGHEIVGEVLAIGPNTSPLDHLGNPIQPSDRVVWGIVANCGKCFYCLHELPQKCSLAFKYGHQQINEGSIWQGGFAQHCMLAPGTTLVRLPEHLTLEAACPLSCATSTIAAAMRIAAPLTNQRVLVVGAGMLGITALAYARELGAARLACLEPDSSRRELALGCFRADIAGDVAELERWIANKQNGIGFDLIIECSGSNAGTLDAMRLMRTGGRCILVGAVFPSAPIPLVFEEFVRRQWTIHGVHNYRSDDLVRAVEFMSDAQARYPFADLVRETFPLKQIERAVIAAQLRENIRVAILP